MSDASTPATRVPRSIRWGSTLLSILLTLLFVWLLSFVLADIGDIQGPRYDDVLQEYVDASLSDREDVLRRRIGDVGTQIERQAQRQSDLRRSMDNARGTMQQMMDLQRLSLEQGVPPTQNEKEALATAQQRFLTAQEDFERANAEIAAANEQRFELEQELREVEEELAEQGTPARAEFDRRWHEHRMQVARYKLAFIVPVFLAAAWATFRFRRSAYRSILIAALAASFWKVGVVMFEHFPREHFKYIAIVAAIAIVLAFLVWLLRKAARPGRDLLLTRYREAYQSHTCPVCAFPVARGPLRFAQWTRKGPRAVVAAAGEVAADETETDYACPSCGTRLFEACARCGRQRHALLPFCEHCGAETGIETGTTAAAEAGTERPADP